jgi:hypothetical protein
VVFQDVHKEGEKWRIKLFLSFMVENGRWPWLAWEEGKRLLIEAGFSQQAAARRQGSEPSAIPQVHEPLSALSKNAAT